MLELLVGPSFEPVLRDPDLFSQVRVERGTVVWPGSIDLCPDVLIWGGTPLQGDAEDSDGSSQE